METRKVQIVNKEVSTHTFYCDNCNKYLGESEEYEDLYYEKLGEFQLNFHFPDDGWYAVNKCLCDNCKKEFLSKLKDALKNFGFEKE